MNGLISTMQCYTSLKQTSNQLYCNFLSGHGDWGIDKNAKNGVGLCRYPLIASLNVVVESYLNTSLGAYSRDRYGVE